MSYGILRSEYKSTQAIIDFFVISRSIIEIHISLGRETVNNWYILDFPILQLRVKNSITRHRISSKEKFYFPEYFS